MSATCVPNISKLYSFDMSGEDCVRWFEDNTIASRNDFSYGISRDVFINLTEELLLSLVMRVKIDQQK